MKLTPTVFRRIFISLSALCLLGAGTLLSAESAGAVHVADDPQIKIPFFDDRRATVVVETTIGNESKHAKELFVETVLKDAQGKEVSREESGLKVDAMGQGSTEQWLNLRNPQMGTPEKPHLYVVHTIIWMGSDIVDTHESSLDVRAAAHGAE